MSEDEYLKERIEDQIQWYSDKSSTNKRLHHWSRVLTILFSIAIPFFVGLNEFVPCTYINIIVSVLGTLTALVSGVSALLKFHEKWQDYRTTSETLKHEKYLFLTKSGPYASDEGNAFNEFVSRIENLVSKQHSAWSQYINEK